MDADAILMISPVYIGSVSAQVKIFWDRMRPIRPTWNTQVRVSQNIIVGGSRIGSQDRVITQANAFLNTTWHVPLSDPNYSSGINAWSGYRFKRVETQYGSGLEGAVEDTKAIDATKEVVKKMIQTVRVFRVGQAKVGSL
jgi:multimeric flavodoxin WrbA